MAPNNSRALGDGSVTTILSIDSRGVRGIIPGIILAFLESELQVRDGKEARLTDYFDFVAGTSTGGLTAAMITTPNEHERPLFAAQDVVNFYLQECPQIFDKLRCGCIPNPFTILCGPKYDKKYFHSLLNERLGDKRLHNTLTNVIIPTFDKKLGKETVFSSLQSKMTPSIDGRLSDICMGTSAAPTYLPAHYFETQSDEEGGGVRKFKLIEGGTSANYPTLCAMTEALNDWDMDRRAAAAAAVGSSSCDSDHRIPRFLVISIGTAVTNKEKESYDTFKEAAGWSILRRFSGPIATSENVNPPLLQFLRIQDNTLEGEISSIDNATEENLNKLVRVGHLVLDEPALKVDRYSDKFVPVDGVTSNREQLTRLAGLLSDEKRLRDAKRRSGN